METVKVAITLDEQEIVDLFLPHLMKNFDTVSPEDTVEANFHFDPNARGGGTHGVTCRISFEIPLEESNRK